MKATPTISIHLLLPCSGLKGRNTTPGAKTFWDPIFVSSFLKKHKIEKGNGMNAVAAGYTTLRLILKDVLSIMLYHDKLACARQDINSVKNWKSKRISCLAAEVHYGLRWWDVGPKGLAWNQSQKPSSPVLSRNWLLNPQASLVFSTTQKLLPWKKLVRQNVSAAAAHFYVHG